MVARGVERAGDPRLPGRAAARPPAAPGPALAAADALQRPAAAEDAARVDRDGVQLLQQRRARRRRARARLGGLRGQAGDREGARRDRRRRRVARRRRAGARSLAAARRTPALGLQPRGLRDGRFVAFESAEGNLNFAKRYGQMRVYVTDRRTGRTELGLARDRLQARPALGLQPVAVGRRARRRLRDLGVRARRARRLGDATCATQRATRIPRPPGVDERPLRAGAVPGRALPRLHRADRSGQSTSTCATCATGRHGAGLRRARRGSRSSARGGRSVAFTRGNRVVVNDLATGATRVVAPPAASASASEPSLSADGRRVAFTARGAGEQDTGVYVRDLATGASLLVSRATGAAGPPAFGASSHPSICAPTAARRVHLRRLEPVAGQVQPGARDLRPRPRGATTTLVSRGDGLNRGVGPTKGSAARARCGSRSSAPRQTPSSSSEL